MLTLRHNRIQLDILLSFVLWSQIFLLYTAASETRRRTLGLGSVDSKKDEMTITIDVVARPIASDTSSRMTETPRSHSSRPSKKSTSQGKKHLDTRKDETIEVTLFQDVTGLRTRAGDTGSVVWRAR